MYIDARKFNYPEPLSSYDQAALERDKREAAKSYKTWVSDNVDEIVERLWEINDIGVVERVGAFVKLLKEAEFTYSLGIYRSAIALIGITAEDLCRFFAEISGNNLDHMKQYNRVNELVRVGLLTAADGALFHRIRGIRNDCLHFNASFKAKSEADLKTEALSVINDLKKIYASIIGVTAYDQIDAAKLSEITKRIATEVAEGAPDGARNLEDAIIRTRNIFSIVTGIDLSINLGGEDVIRWSCYVIEDIDLDWEPPEVSLLDVTNGLPVIVDLAEDQVDAVRALGLSQGQTVFAALKSVTNNLGMSAEWKFMALPILAPD